MASLPLVVGVYGKIGSQPDFLRSNAGEFSQAGLDLWFQEAVEALRGEGTSLPEAPTGFLLAPAGSASSFVGAFSPSTDAAGRSFPLVIFAPIAAADMNRGDGAPSPSAYHDAFVRTAGTLASAASAASVASAASLSGPEVVARSQEIGAEGSGGTSSDGRIVLADESAQPLVAALGDGPAALGYALRTFVSACDQAAKTGPAGRAGVITVDAPAPSVAVRELWIEIARRRLRWRDGAPSLLWTQGADGRLLLTLGQPSAAMLCYLANPRHRASRFWPLRTAVAPAIEQAMKALTPEQRRRVENPRISLGDLVASFS